MKKQLEQLLEFHERFACHIETTPTASLPEGVSDVRTRLIQEELDEYRQALAVGDIVKIGDALSDLLYVVLGTYVAHGLQDVAGPMFDEIHRSNMSKLDDSGKPILRADDKILKPEQWSPPDLGPIIEAAKGKDSG